LLAAACGTEPALFASPQLLGSFGYRASRAIEPGAMLLEGEVVVRDLSLLAAPLRFTQP
jgi:hypothetical protein